MSGFIIDIENNRILIVNGARTVATTEGTLVGLSHEYGTQAAPVTFNAVFPDLAKDYWYNWQQVMAWDFANDEFHRRNMCQTHQTIVPQEYDVETVLTAMPAGTDFFTGLVKLNRTTAPTHSWGGNSIDVLAPQNVWIPFNGSMLLEAEIGMARALSIYPKAVVEGGVEVRKDLVLRIEQSVSTPPGGWGTFGNTTGSNSGSVNGGENVYGSQPGIPVVPIDTQGWSEDAVKTGVFGTPPLQNHRVGASQACALTISTNFRSIYQVQVAGWFGRRS